ncbi:MULTISPECIES: hypothetical protein [Pseudomonas]|uniref:Uncharacterized protein n=1 Tax=Pseudomonas putida TaxID=303 RepID=A0A8I1JQS8_PSEPU|nr:MULTISPECIES: hypothetical protein [Pseudomonas]MBI6888895.1 hypothetical protein [Pseudomonas putida]
MSPEKKIMATIRKGYRRPHDIEMLASEIYTWLCNDKLASREILMEFVSSVNNSKFPDVIQLTFEYLKRLSTHESELLYEESEKIGHLFDSINIMTTLGLHHDDNIIKESDELIINTLKSKRFTNPPKQINTEKPWWSRISDKLLKEHIPNKNL